MAGKKRGEQATLIKGGLVVTGSSINKSDVLLAGAKIAKIAKTIKASADTVIDAKGLYVMPGIIDPHVHLRTPGQEHKEDFSSGTAAAAHGGVTTVLDMPNNKRFVCDQESLDEKIEVAKLHSLFCNVGFFLGINQSNVDSFWKIKHCVGYKAYLCGTTGADGCSSQEFLRALCENHSLHSSKPLYVHSETEKEIPKSLAEHDEFRSELAELEATTALVQLSKKLHITHVSSPFTADMLVKEKVSFDLTPHHCLLSIELGSRLGQTVLKVNPPIRKHSSSKFLAGFFNASNCLFCTDHAPHSIQDKHKRFIEAPAGISSLDIELPLWIQIFGNSFGLEKALKLIAGKNLRIAKKFRLSGRGAIAPGMAADLAIVSAEPTTVECRNWFSKAKLSPYDGMVLNSSIYATIVNGAIAYHLGKLGKPEGLIFL